MLFKPTELSDKSVINIINDLLLKYPKGPHGKIKKDSYTVDESWRPSTGHYGNIVRMKNHGDPLFGYDIATLCKVKWALDGNYRYTLRSIASGNITETALSRRTNRLEDRMSQIQRAFDLANVPSIYLVKFSNMYSYRYRGHWADPSVIVVASTDNTAKLLGKTVAAGAGVVVSEDKIVVRRMCVNDEEILNHYRKMYVDKLVDSISKLRHQSEIVKEQIERLMSFSVSMADFNNATS